MSTEDIQSMTSGGHSLTLRQTSQQQWWLECCITKVWQVRLALYLDSEHSQPHVESRPVD